MTVNCGLRGTRVRNGAAVTGALLPRRPATCCISKRSNGCTKHRSSDIKNTTQQMNASQTIAASNQYDAFGKEVSTTGMWTGQSKYGGVYGYQSEPDPGLMLLGHRYYDSTTGRFLTRDPNEAGRNWLRYCKQNPVGTYDCDGVGVACTSPQLRRNDDHSRLNNFEIRHHAHVFMLQIVTMQKISSAIIIETHQNVHRLL